MHEIANAALLLLRTGAMKPVAIDLMNHLPEEASSLVKMVVAACQDTGLALAGVRLSPEMAADLREWADAPNGYCGVQIHLVPDLGRRIEFLH